MKILDIYEKYKIMPQLREHQLKVTAAAEFICENFEAEIEKDEIVKACLLHDMGNIVKFDFTIAPEGTQEKGLEYWHSVKKEFEEKYGKTTHEVTANILKEMGIGGRVFDLVNSVGFNEAKDNAASKDFGKKICGYADMRVLPHGVGTLEERMADLRIRYKNTPDSGNRRDEFDAALREIEKQIFAHCRIKPEDITEERIKDRLKKLQNIEI